MWKRTLPVIAVVLASLLAACGGAADPTPAPALDPELARGKRVFEVNCGACHSVTRDTTLVGPSLAGIGTRAATRVDGLDARAYLYTSIMRPGDYLVDGFQNRDAQHAGQVSQRRRHRRGGGVSAGAAMIEIIA